MAKHEPLMMRLDKMPRVLLLGNGLLRLGGGGDWSALLKKISNCGEEPDLSGIPYAMQPEALCGTDVEEVQRKTAEAISNSPVHELLDTLLRMDFDAILTTNYTYEIEETLSGKPWTEYQRRKAFCALDGHASVRHNTCICNIVKREDGREVPVFHIHGDMGRKHSLVLSYYSYANSVSKLIEFNRSRGNQYQELQMEDKPMEVQSWLDYFLMGDVFSVGLGFDTSEFDLWWAVERKSREYANHGITRVYFVEPKDRSLPQEVLLPAMKAEYERITVSEEKSYEDAYRSIVKKIGDHIGSL